MADGSIEVRGAEDFLSGIGFPIEDVAQAKMQALGYQPAEIVEFLSDEENLAFVIEFSEATKGKVAKALVTWLAFD
ncbi:hypothetical protein A3J23_03855 [Candidatus Peregrinibacteria bacterium RIFCSPLOWO2_02_FULL_48_14]|nr:MAG: hypothetical protein A3J23_03855 [Candidatus Peregrinibacteria bacterium RIFCSPLOWO2_02_FULL_48_14]